MERGYAKGRATKRKIVEEAAALFGEVGYRGASLREIAARCGISHPGLLHHFPSKEVLLREVLAYRDELDTARIGLTEATGVEIFARIVSLVAENARQPNLIELFATLSAEATAPDHPAHEYFVGRYRTVVDGLARAYEQARAQGALREGIDPGAAARELVALMDGLQVQWLLDPEATDMPGLVREYLGRQFVVSLSPQSP